MKQFFYVGIFLTFFACKKSENMPQSINGNAEITQKVNEMYSIYGKSTDAMYKNPFSDTIFSTDLKKTLDDAVNASNTNIKQMEKEHPGDKPQLFEGSVFTSLYEGYTTYKINSVKIIKNSIPSQAEVSVEFENSGETPQIVWTDKISLTNTGSGWRIDNINFDRRLNPSDLKNSLKAFMEGARITN